MMSTLLAVDDGFVHGKLDLADLLFLIAAILFGVGAFVAWSVNPRLLWATLVALGLCLVSIAWFVL